MPLTQKAIQVIPPGEKAYALRPSHSGDLKTENHSSGSLRTPATVSGWWPWRGRGTDVNLLRRLNSRELGQLWLDPPYLDRNKSHPLRVFAETEHQAHAGEVLGLWDSFISRGTERSELRTCRPRDFPQPPPSHVVLICWALLKALNLAARVSEPFGACLLPLLSNTIREYP
jgi:hypothetical protein